MRFSRFFPRSCALAARYRPAIDLLEDRTVPALFRPIPVRAPVLPPATHLHVIVPQHVESGAAFTVVVQAEDAKNRLVANYTGTVQIRLGLADAGAQLPASFTFSASDQGQHAFQATLSKTGAQTVKATSGKFAGKAALTVDGMVTHFAFHASDWTYAGAPTTITVTAMDADNHVVPGYAGTVSLASTDYYTWLPADYKFQPADKGSHVFSLTFYIPGIQTFTVADESRNSLLGNSQFNVVTSWYYSAYTYYPVYYSWNWSYPWY